MTAERIERGDIAICAALGPAMAGCVLGIWLAINLLAPSAGVEDAIPMIPILALVGTIFAVGIGTPIGFCIGFIIARFVGVGIGHAALTGALTGAAYPLFMLVAGLLMDAKGLSLLIGSFALFGAVGAACGACTYWLVIGRKRQRG